MLSRTLRNSRSRFTSVSAPLLRIEEVESELENGKKAIEKRPSILRLGKGTHGLIPLGGVFIILLALLLSLLFILTISLTFANANDTHSFKKILDDTAQTNPGVRGQIKRGSSLTSSN